MLAKILTLDFTGTIELGFSKLCNFLNCFSDYPSDLFFVQTCDSESLPHTLFSCCRYFLKCSGFQEFFFCLFFFFFKKGFSLSKTLYHALAFMSLNGHEVMRALLFTSAG